MATYNGYNPKNKDSIMKYMKEKRDKLTLDLPKGTKDKWRERIAITGDRSITQYIIRLIEQDIEENP